ncbi:MAG: CBS domain-containing protein [Leucobacter sp.]
MIVRDEAHYPRNVRANENGREDAAIATMKKHQVRRLPVIDGHDLVGMLAQADIARHLPDDQAGNVVEDFSK